MALILAGAIGNLIDFLDVYYSTWRWPAFNIADSAITLGVFLMLLGIVGDWW